MDPVRAQYEAYPYPERDPEEERRRLIVGSPSDPVEIDHFLFRGRRDWREPFRALVAGGGTGDGLIQLAQRLKDAGCPAEITYLDLSAAARAVAEARARVRDLNNIRFLTGDLMMAPELGSFDYVDCCGVLHHLEAPKAGMAALAASLAPEGGMGLMVYAPYGRTGVYALQEGFGALFAGDLPAEKLRLAREAVGALPPTNWFLHNPFLSDHRASDAGLYDLLLHARDRPFDVASLAGALAGAGLGLVSFLEPARYDPLRYLPAGEAFRARVAALDPLARMALAERLAGDMRLHIAYVTRAGREGEVMARPGPEAVPRLNRLPARALAETVAKRGEVVIDYPGAKYRVAMPREAARLIAAIGGRPLGELARAAGLDWIAFAQHWAPVHRGLTGFNRLHYSGFPA
ncbi:MAG TPA: class I SAM-dependent methyltransferase [Paracoccaceae bacterium]|nr:class I SAM-dependent methyltransferase [Paracoccaceae bacterium]